VISNPVPVEIEMKYRYLLRDAYEYARQNSQDRSTHVGALLIDATEDEVIARGANRYPADSLARNEANHERPRKYTFIEHAERDVIFACASMGEQTKGLIMVCPWACCADCARAIVLAGIPLVVAHKQAYDMSPDRWRQSLAEGQEILQEGGVVYHLWDGKIGETENLFNGEVWKP
jgi:dCMP deaminase